MIVIEKLKFHVNSKHNYHKGYVIINNQFALSILFVTIIYTFDACRIVLLSIREKSAKFEFGCSFCWKRIFTLMTITL